MKKTAYTVAAVLCSAVVATDAQTTLTSGHLDLGIAFEEGAFDLHIHDEANDIEYSPSEAILQVGSQGASVVPDDPRYAFLGPAGSPVYTLPQVQNPSLLLLGVGAEIENGVFERNQLALTLRAITGPGHFVGYTVDGFGNPTVHYSTRDGMGPDDFLNVSAGSHSELNWAFTARGSYTLSFEASGTLAGGAAIASGPVDFTFRVVQEITTFDDEHLDLSIGYDLAAEPNPLTLFFESHDQEREFALSNFIVQVGESARLTLPAGTIFGGEGDSLWVLPQSQNPALVYMGLSAETLPNIFAKVPSLKLISVEGPGDFFVWQATQFGNLEMRMNSRDGIGASDRLSPTVGSHEHLNWGFTTNGIYRVTFQAEGRRAGESTNIVSEPGVVTFHVLPLPDLPTNPFQRWQTAQFGADAVSAAPGNDPDADGMVNVVEYALGTDPRSPSSRRLPTGKIVTDGGITYFELEFPRVAAATDVRFVIESTEKISAGEWDSLLTTSVTHPTGATEVIVVRDPEGAKANLRKFYRVRVELIQ